MKTIFIFLTNDGQLYKNNDQLMDNVGCFKVIDGFLQFISGNPDELAKAGCIGNVTVHLDNKQKTFLGSYTLSFLRLKDDKFCIAKIDGANSYVDLLSSNLNVCNTIENMAAVSHGYLYSSLLNRIVVKNVDNLEIINTGVENLLAKHEGYSIKNHTTVAKPSYLAVKADNPEVNNVGNSVLIILDPFTGKELWRNSDARGRNISGSDNRIFSISYLEGYTKLLEIFDAFSGKIIKSIDLKEIEGDKKQQEKKDRFTFNHRCKLSNGIAIFPNQINRSGVFKLCDA